MSNTSITNVEITDTFQVWLNKTNAIIELANENVMLAGPGGGFTVSGNSTLVGSFTANTLNSDSATVDNLSIINLSRKTTPNTPIQSASPIKITSQIENIFDLQTTFGAKPIVRLINGEDARWLITHGTVNNDSPITIKLEGAVTPQLSLTQNGNLSVSGTVSAPAFEGDGALLTNINATSIPDLDASKVTTGTFDDARIPDLAASKITSGAFADARIPNLAASKITSGTFTNARIPVLETAKIPNLDASKITTGAFADARIPDLAASKITSGTFLDARIPGLDTSKITSGTFADARIAANIARVDSIIRFNSIGVNTGASGTAGEIRATNNITAFFSDDRLKTRLGNIEEALEKINTLDAFYYIPNKTAIDLGYNEEQYIGLSAQQVNEILPEVVKPAPIDDKYLTIQYDKLIPLLVAAIKELKSQVNSMQKEIKEVKK